MVAGRRAFSHVQAMAIERGCAGTPQQRQEPRRVFEELVALADRRQVEPERTLLGCEPSQSQAARRPPVGEHVERGDRLAQEGNGAVIDRCHKRPEPDPLGRRGKPRKGGEALQHVLPGATDLRDLPQVIHDVQRRESSVLGRGRDRAQMSGRCGRTAGEGDCGMCSPNVRRVAADEAAWPAGWQRSVRAARTRQRWRSDRPRRSRPRPAGGPTRRSVHVRSAAPPRSTSASPKAPRERPSDGSGNRSAPPAITVSPAVVSGERAERSVVVRLVRDLGHQFGVHDVAGHIDDHDGARGETLHA